MQQGRQINPELGIRKAHKKDPEEASEMVHEREVPVCVPVNPHVQKGGHLAKRYVSVDLTALTPAQFCLLLNNCLLMKTEEVEWILVKSVGRKGLLGSKGIIPECLPSMHTTLGSTPVHASKTTAKISLESEDPD